MAGILDDFAKSRPTDSALRWRHLDTLWDRGSTQIITNINIKRPYLRALLQQGLENGVTYFETRRHLGPDETIYVLDPDYSENNGKRPLGDADLDVNITQQVTS